MKILKDNEYAALKEKADAYDALNLKGDETPVVEETPENPEDEDEEDEEETPNLDELNTQISTLTEKLTAMTTRAENAEARVAELEDLPADEPVGSKAPKTDENGSSLDEVNNAVKSSKSFAASIEKVRALL